MSRSYPYYPCNSNAANHGRGRQVRPVGRATGWHHDYSPPAWCNRATEEQKRVGWKMAVRIEKILCTALREAHEQQVEETMETLEEGPERFYREVTE